MLQIILYTVCAEFPFDCPSGAASSVSLRAAALYHEARNDAMKCQAVIKPFCCQFLEIFHTDRRDFRIQFSCHHAAVFHFYDHFFHVL